MANNELISDEKLREMLTWPSHAAIAMELLEYRRRYGALKAEYFKRSDLPKRPCCGVPICYDHKESCSDYGYNPYH